MNNFCTNCGKSLEDGEYVCKNCNTPVVDIYSPNMIEESRPRKYFVGFLIFVGIIILVINWGGNLISELGLETLFPSNNSTRESGYDDTNYTQKDYDVVYDNLSLPITTDFLDVHDSHVIYFKNENAYLTVNILLNVDNITATIKGDHVEKLRDIQSFILDYYDQNQNRVARCNGNYDINNSGQMWACTILTEQIHSIADSSDIHFYQITIQ